MQHQSINTHGDCGSPLLEPTLQGQSPAVLGVKPAIEDVDVRVFLAFHRAIVEDRIEPSSS